MFKLLSVLVLMLATSHAQAMKCIAYQLEKRVFGDYDTLIESIMNRDQVPNYEGRIRYPKIPSNAFKILVANKFTGCPQKLSGPSLFSNPSSVRPKATDVYSLVTVVNKPKKHCVYSTINIFSEQTIRAVCRP